MSNQKPEHNKLEDFWAQEFEEAQPIPSAEFLNRLTQKLSVHAEQQSGGDYPMNMAQPSFSNNGHHPEMPLGYLVNLPPISQMRWIAAVAVLGLVLMGTFFVFTPGEVPAQQTDECDVTPRTGWLVHIVEDETLVDLAEQYNQSIDDLMMVNCLSSETVEAGQILHIPTDLTTIWVTTEPISAGTEITRELIEPVHVISDSTMQLLDLESLIGQYALTDINGGMIMQDEIISNLQSEIEYNGQIYTAQPDEYIEIIEIIELPDLQIGPYATLFFKGSGTEDDCEQLSLIDHCTNIELENGEYRISIPIKILHQSDEAIVVSLSRDDALLYQQLNLFYPEYAGEITKKPLIIPRDRLAMGVPVDNVQLEQLAKIPWNENVSIDIEILYCDADEFQLPVAESTPMSEESLACENIQSATHTISAVLLSLTSIDNPATGTPVFIASVAVTPQDAVVLEWAIDSDLDIRVHETVD